MNNKTQQIFKEQLGKLPSEVVEFLSSANWDGDIDEIGSLYNLSPKELSDLHREATLVLAGLAHPDEFGDNLEQEAGIHGAVRDAIVTAVEQRIFAPVRSALVDFLDSEARNDAEQTRKNAEENTTQMDELNVPEVPLNPNLTPKTSNLKPSPAPQLSGATRLRADTRGQAPDNLPVAEPPEYLTPPLAPKSANLEVEPPSEEESTEPAHPFEEKMKRVFTGGQQTMGDLTLTPAAPQVPTATQPSHSDPYREAIE